MTQAVVTLSHLLEVGRWKAEQFCGPRQNELAGVFGSAPLGDFVSERREFLDPQAFPTHTVHYIGLEHVAPDTGDLIEYAPRLGQEIKSRSKVFRSGDVLYGRLRSYLNKVFVATPPVSEGVCSGEFLVLVPDIERCDPVFLRQLLASRGVQQATSGLQSGSALPRLHLDDLLRIRLPLPPLDRQRQLCAVLEVARQRRLAARHILTEQPRAIEEAFSKCLTDGLLPRPDMCSPVVSCDVTVCALPDVHAARPRGRPRVESRLIVGR